MLMSRATFMEIARASLERFEATHAERNTLFPTQYPTSMLEADWWSALMKNVREENCRIDRDVRGDQRNGAPRRKTER